MSVSEALDPVPPSAHLNEPKFDPTIALGELDEDSKSMRPIRSDQSSQYTPPSIPSKDLDLGPVQLSGKQEDRSVANMSPHEPLSVKTEQGIPTPHSSDIANGGSNQAYKVPSQSVHQQSASGSAGYGSDLGRHHGSDENGPQSYLPLFVVNLEMVKRTMEGVNRLLGVDLSDTEVSESALLDDPSKELGNDDSKVNGLGMEHKDQVVVAKGEYSHMRLICDACGHIVAAVGRAVLDAARESYEEGVKQGTPGMRPKPPVRKKRGGILGFKELAARANLSPWHFHRVFRVTTGVTPKTYGEALWEYLMLESGFNLDNEELTIDRNLNGKPNQSLSQGISPSSSSSPQSPTMAPSQYSPNSSTRSPPLSASVIGTSGPQPASHGSTMAQNNSVPGTGRVRKVRSRSRPSRSRSRTRSQTQSQVLTTLSAIGDGPAVDPGQRGRSFTRGVSTPVPVPPAVSQNINLPAGMNGAAGHTPQMPPPSSISQMGADSYGATAFDADWFGPPEDLLSGLGGQHGGPHGHNVSIPTMGGQDLDAQDLTALSLQHLGLDQSATPGPPDLTDLGQRADPPGWPMAASMSPITAPSSMASSAPDVSLLASGYGNPASRFKSPESIANGERGQHMNNSFAMSSFHSSSQNIYEDTPLNSYVGSLNMNSFHGGGDFGVHRGVPMPNVGMNGAGGYPHNTMSPTGVNGFSEDINQQTVPHGLDSHGLDSQIPSTSTPSLHTLHKDMHDGFQPNYHGPMQGTLPDNFQDNLQQEMFQQHHHHQTHDGDGLGALGDLPTSFYLGSKDSPKYDTTSKQDDDDFVSALIGDDPPMLPSWNETDKGHIREFGF